MYEGYLPISKQDMQERGIKQLDFCICVRRRICRSSVFFGHAIIARLAGGTWLYGGNHCAAGLEG